MTAVTTSQLPRLGPWLDGNTLCVRTWAPDHSQLELVLHDATGKPTGEALPMTREEGGFFFARVSAPPAKGQLPLYKIRVDGQGPFPDPWARALPFGVHGPAAAVDETAFRWTDDAWQGLPLESLVLYELHVGTATAEGTFEAVIPQLEKLRSLGVTAIELLPVASFPGERNWGYDGVALFAPAQVYGGPDGLRRLVDAAHRQGLAVIMDAVYNHFGPDGNYLSVFSRHYFNAEHKTPWGDAINYGGPNSAVVRELALSNAEMWIRDYHLDGLRLDATHAIIDETQPHLLAELVRRAKAAAPGRTVVVMAEDDRNDARLVRSPEEGGYGLDGVWADDLHHQLRRAFAKDSEGYFEDYTGSVADIVRTLEQGWFYTGQKSKHSGKNRGTSAQSVRPPQLIHCLQNHDQIGNRPFGNRLSEDVSPAAFRAMSALLLLSPYTPLLYAGQEWNSRTPFLYFTHHHPELGKLVTEGRRKEFSGFSKFKGADVPDPQAEETFLRSKLDWTEAEKPGHAELRALYRELLGLRREHPALTRRERGDFEVRAVGNQAFVLVRKGAGEALHLLVNLDGTSEYELGSPNVRLVLHTEEARFGGTGGSTVLQGGKLRLEGPSAALVAVR